MIYRFSDLPICHLPQFLTFGHLLELQPVEADLLGETCKGFEWGKVLKRCDGNPGCSQLPRPSFELGTQGAASQGPQPTPLFVRISKTRDGNAVLSYCPMGPSSERAQNFENLSLSPPLCNMYGLMSQRKIYFKKYTR